MSFLRVSKTSDGLARSSMESKETRKKRKKPGSNGVGKIDGYNKKIKHSFCSVQEITRRNKGKEDHLNQAPRFCEKVMKETSSEDYLTLLKCLNDYGTGKITMVDLKMKIADYFPSFMDDFDRVLELYGSSSPKFDGKINDQGKKPEEEIDELTESYQFLPKDLSGVHSSGITQLGKQVLNSCCFSKGSFGEGAPRSISPSEKMLNEREDELFTIDMLKAWMRSTRENATKLLNAFQKPTMEDVNHHLTGYNFRFIAKMYEKDGSLMVDQLRHAPETVLPVLINRLDKMEIETLSRWTLD